MRLVKVLDPAGGPVMGDPQPAAADRLESALQRRQIHAQGGQRANPADPGPRSRRDRSQRHRPGHFARVSAPTSSSASARPTPRPPAATPAWGWGWRSSAIWSSCTAARSIVFSPGEGQGAKLYRLAARRSSRPKLSVTVPCRLRPAGARRAACAAPPGRRAGAGGRRRTGEPRTSPPAAGRMRGVGRDGRFGGRGNDRAAPQPAEPCCCPTSACRKKMVTP